MASTFIIFVALALCIWCTLAVDITPCNLKDYACIGGYMHRASGCSLKTRGEVNFDPRNALKEFTVSSPSTSTLDYRPRTMFYGARQAYITLFFHELVSGRTVLQFFLPYYKMVGESVVTFYDSGVKPYSVKSTYETTFRNFTLTVDFDNISTMNLDTAKITAKLGTVVNVAGKGFTKAAAKNKRVADYVTTFTQRPQKLAQEFLDETGYGIASNLIYHRLCDYEAGH